MGVVGQRHSSAALLGPCTAGWVPPRDGVNQCRNSRLHRDSIPGMPSPIASGCTDDTKTKNSRVLFHDGLLSRILGCKSNRRKTSTISSSSSCSGRIRFDSCFLYPQNEIGASISSSVVLCVFVLLVYIVVLV